jgi:hypothetical protein
MVKYTIYIQAEFGGVASLRLKENADLCVSVRNPLQQEEIREKVVLEGATLIKPEVQTNERHRNEHPYHLALKWEHGDTTRATARILEATPVSAAAAQGGEFVKLVELECDGLEPYDFHPLGEEFVVVDKAGKEHDLVDLSGGDWSAYDMGTGSTSVLNFKCKIE